MRWNVRPWSKEDYFLVQTYIRELLFSLGRSIHYLRALFNQMINIDFNRAALRIDCPLHHFAKQQLSNNSSARVIAVGTADLSSFGFF